jgi:membrane fusion protein
MTSIPLFRPEAVDFQRDRLRSGGVLPVAPPAASLTSLLVGFVAASLGFLLTCDYARKETASGFLSPTVGVARVFPPRAGRVVSVHVVEGQEVAAGAPLITVQVGGTNDRGGDVDEAVLQSLAQQRRALTEQTAQEETRAEAESRRLGDRIDGLSMEIGELQREWKTQDMRTKLAEEQVSAVRELVKRGFISVVEFQRRQDNYLAQHQSEASLAEQIIAKQGEMSQQRHVLAELPGGLATRIATLQASIAELDGRLAEIEGRRAYMIRAPVAGHVSALQARPGLSADTAIPQLAVVPSGVALQAELLVPARAIGFIEAGQPVRLAYDAFPFQRFGFHGGHVATVSRTQLRPSELVGPLVLREPSYRVTVALDRQTVPAMGRQLPLAADMTLRADIVFDRRSLMEWLLEPVLSLRGRWS